MKKILTAVLLACLLGTVQMMAIDHKGIAHHDLSPDRFPVIAGGVPTAILADAADNSAVQIALKALQKDFKAVSGNENTSRRFLTAARSTVPRSWERMRNTS